jgi:hypothetical protein
MSWALGRRVLILSIVGVFVVTVVGGITWWAAYTPPSCTDGKQNQDEEGIDCGVACPYLCTAGLAEPSVEFARYISPQTGRIDVIAYIENPNPSADARDVAFSIELLDASNGTVATKEGLVDLPPSSVVPVYVPNFFSGNATVARVFLVVDPDSFKWFSYEDELPAVRVRSTNIESTATPRITATLHNPSAMVLRNVKTIITVFNNADNAIAASQTIIPELPGQGEAEAVFTWRTPFSETPSRVEVLTVLPF